MSHLGNQRLVRGDPTFAMSLVSVEPWVTALLVDPLGKGGLVKSADSRWLTTSYGRKYPIRDKIFDLRVLNHYTTPDQRRWKAGQSAYEEWANDAYLRDAKIDFQAERESMGEVYAEIPIEGRCLDVGGGQGRLRAFVRPGQTYISCDPILNPFIGLERQPNLVKAYPFLLEPVNFLACEAEFLPFRSGSFQTVHMRSVIDHFCSPELALNEAYRVLEPEGALIVGIYVSGGRVGRLDLKKRIKEALRRALVKVGLRRFEDHHVWHPTYAELRDLVEQCGFQIDRVHWQKGWGDTVCYLRGIKQPALCRK
jgi:SAM-dependent methyltransferase